MVVPENEGGSGFTIEMFDAGKRQPRIFSALVRVLSSIGFTCMLRFLNIRAHLPQCCAVRYMQGKNVAREAVVKTTLVLRHESTIENG